MKQHRRKVTAVLSALLLTGILLGSASAASGKVMQEIEYRNVKVSLNGEILDLRNAAGEPVEPFLFGGTNYLPVRALAEALGLHVAWDSPNATILLTTPEEAPARQEGAGPIGNFFITLKDAKLSRSEDGRSAIIFTYNWKNTSEETEFAYGSISDVAFQDGVELDEMDISEGLGSGPEWKWVRPGASVDLHAAYYLSNDESPVEFEVYEYANFSDDGEAVYRTYELGTLEVQITPNAPVKDPV